MTQNKTDKGTTTVDIHLKAEVTAELERRAKALQLSTSTYCRLILQQCIDTEKILTPE